MFGYIRPQAEELRVREYTYYRAVYCGLCHCMAKRISPFFSLTLRYDFVLLAMVRTLLTQTQGVISAHRCAANPFHKKPTMEENDALLYAARTAALLTEYGVKDSIADETGAKRLAYRMLHPLSRSMYRKAKKGGDLDALDAVFAEQLRILHTAEQEKIPSPDAAAEPFGILLGELFAFGLPEEDSRRIASACGKHIGRFIYLCDAADDAPADALSGSYNPLVCAAAEENLPIAAYLKQSEERLRTSMILECSRALLALQLSPLAGHHPVWPCLENILTLGMPAAAEHVIRMPGVPLSRKDAGKTAGTSPAPDTAISHDHQ